MAAGGGEDVVERRRLARARLRRPPSRRPFAPVEHAGELRIDIRSRETGELTGVALFQSGSTITERTPRQDCSGRWSAEVARKDGVEGARLVRGARLGTPSSASGGPLRLPAPDRAPPDWPCRRGKIQHGMTVTRPSTVWGLLWKSGHAGGHGSTPLVRLRP